MTEKFIGYVGVDSGQMMLVDPCYIDSSWEKSEIVGSFPDHKGEFNYNGACNASLSEDMAGIIGHELGIVCSTGWGDGCYPVYVTYEGNRVSEMRIVFMADEEESVNTDEDDCENCNASFEWCECE